MKREGQSVDAPAAAAEAEGTSEKDSSSERGNADDGAEALEGGAEMLLELVLAEHATRAAEEAEAARPARIDGVMIGELVAVGEAGEARVAFAGCPVGGASARAMTALSAGDVGREVALLFEGGDPRRPVVMGLMHVPGGAAAQRPTARADGGRLELAADKEIVLRCGKASITLTQAGKILIRGAYLLARSSGVNRIQGGSVQIN